MRKHVPPERRASIRPMGARVLAVSRRSRYLLPITAARSRRGGSRGCDRSLNFRRRPWTVEIAPIRQRCARRFDGDEQQRSKKFHRADANRTRARCQRGSEFASSTNASIFLLRQGLWTEGLRTPPGQECSNGSLTFLAVVLWRIFS
jgi:hypothetical protein